MALILQGVTRCPICESTDLTRAYLATSGGFFPEGHELWRFCDAPLHLDCLERWPDRRRFARGYFDLWRDECLRGHGVLLAERSSWLLRCGPAKADADPYYAEVRLSEWPLRLYSRWDEWSHYVAKGYRDGLLGQVLDAADEAMSQVRDVAPTVSALRAARQKTLRGLSPAHVRR